MELHQFFRILFLHMFWSSLVFVCVYATVVNNNAFVIASLFEVYLYCPHFISFMLPHTIFQMKGMFRIG